MKKIYIILFIIIFSIGFKAGDYDSDGRYKYLPKKIKYFFNKLFSKNKKKVSEKKIETPIIDQINNVLFFGKDPKLAIKDLLNRKNVKE